MSRSAEKAVEKMAKGAVIDVESLLLPIEGEDPAGADLKHDESLEKIRLGLRSDQESGQQPEYKKVIKLASAVLIEKSKDLRVAVALSEALVGAFQFAGLSEGFRVIGGLLDQYWDGLHPQVEDGDLEGRANLLDNLDKQLAQMVKNIPLTSSAKGAKYSYLNLESYRLFADQLRQEFSNGNQLSRLTADVIRERAAEEGKIPEEDWNRARDTTPESFYRVMGELMDKCSEALRDLDRTIDTRFGVEAPGLGQIKKAIELTSDIVYRADKSRRQSEMKSAAPTIEFVVGNPEAAEPEISHTRSDNNQTAVVTGRIASRQDALNRLQEVADYFRVAEPQSPVSYLAERAIKWGNMPLEVWLKDVMGEDSALGRVRETLGLKEEREDES